MSPSRFLIVGLGNPGREYEWTRHNLGFMVVDEVARLYGGGEVKRAECRALVGRAVIDGAPVELAKPQTYMNLSGESVACLVKKRELKAAAELIVVSDDLALPFGKIRLRGRGSSGGQKGLASIIGALGTDEFARLRVGIGPEHPVTNVPKFVLEKFPSAIRADVEATVRHSAEAVATVVRDGLEKAMAVYNGDK